MWTQPLSALSPAPVKYLLNGWRADFQLLLWRITANSQLNTTQMYSSTALQVRSLKLAECIETKVSTGLVSSGGLGFPVLAVSRDHLPSLACVPSSHGLTPLCFLAHISADSPDSLVRTLWDGISLSQIVQGSLLIAKSLISSHEQGPLAT